MEYQPISTITATEDFNFSDEPVKYGPFSIGKRTFILHECTEAAFTAYRNIVSKSVRRDDDTKTIYQNGGQEADAMLIQRCLYEVTSGKEIPTPLAFVEDLPRKISSKLYQKIREISEFDKEEETIELLTKRIASDTEKLNALNEGKDTAAKNV